MRLGRARSRRSIAGVLILTFDGSLTPMRYSTFRDAWPGDHRKRSERNRPLTVVLRRIPQAGPLPPVTMHRSPNQTVADDTEVVPPNTASPSAASYRPSVLCPFSALACAGLITAT